MTPTPPKSFTHCLRRNPLALAAVAFITGAALGIHSNLPVQLPLEAAGAFWIIWLTAELALAGPRRTAVTHACLCLALLSAGTSLAELNQHYAQNLHLARFAQTDDPIPITARLHVVSPPQGNPSHGNIYFIASTTGLLTQQGWIPSAGELRIKWRAGMQGQELHRGDLIEINGWLNRPDPALNPGALDLRQTLAADRIFAELRIPRPSGVTLLAKTSDDAGPDALTRIRLFLRDKLLRHTADIDTEAGYSMVALLLGHRDPAIADVSQAFADAGVAHLLAISGAHIVFFTALIWGILRFIPLRPRKRKIIIALIVILYVLATPCGPAVVRAAIGFLMVLTARLLGRPRMYVNMLAAAAVLTLLLRPADLLDAGAQLTFVCTLAIILLSERLYAALFAKWMDREKMFAELNSAAWAKFKFNLKRSLCALFSANVVAAGTAMPLVAFHFERVNPYAIFTGWITFPLVGATMTVSSVQLLLEVTSAKLAALFAPISTSIARFMVWIVEHLASLPSAAIALHAPPLWLMFLLYGAILLWAIRRWIKLPRAAVINAGLAVLAITIFWYAFTQPINELHLQILSVGQGSSVLLRTPGGQLWIINAGSRDTTDITDKTLAPAIRLAGVNHLDGLIVTSLSTVAAQSAGDAVTRFHPPIILTSPADWDHRNWTFPGAQLESAITETHAQQISITGGHNIRTGNNSPIKILWPLQDPKPLPQNSLLLQLEYRGHRILLMDTNAPSSLALPQYAHINIQAEIVILLGPERGIGDDSLRTLIQHTGAKTLIWSGRTPWAPPRETTTDLNTHFGYIDIRIDNAGTLTTSR